MKTYKRLFTRLLAFENLLLAAQEATRGKHDQPQVLAFCHRLEDNLWQLQAELAAQSYQPGQYSTFEIYRPKPRLISAAPLRDRVVHHALMNIIGPLFERSFIFDCYANRLGKGTHRAIRRFQHFLKQFAFGLKCDIRKYFPAIDRELLKGLLRRRIADAKTLWLIDRIIDSGNPPEPVLDYFPGDDLFTPLSHHCGLPIGNLTSQFFANIYLSPLDHFVKEQLRCRGYLRYVDDFVLFGESAAQLQLWQRRLSQFLADYRLQLHPRQCYIFPTRVGRPFLGQLIFRTHRRLRAANVRAFKRRLRVWRKQPPENLVQRLASWVGHAQQADTYGLLTKLKLLEPNDKL